MSVARCICALVLPILLAAPAAGAEPSPGQDDESRPAIEALRIDGPVDVDGHLDEPFWERADPGTGFVQREPDPGAPASERTEIRIAFDQDNLYIAILAHDSEPGAIVAREMGRDGGGGGGGFGDSTGNLSDDDSVAIVLDTFHDSRNAFFFETNPLGARSDGLIEDEGRPSFEWDGVWRVGARQHDGGWTAELEIPFSTFRFDPANSTWGLNVRRLIRRKNEEAFWAPVGLDANIERVSLAGDLQGITGLTRPLNLRIKPYAIGTSVRDFADPELSPGESFDGGLDLLRWGVTDNLTVDLTANTDFAQVEADEQRVNLTRFSLFFPEKREFFLENAGIFDFGSGGGGPGRGPSLQLFFSRNIGLEAGQVVPLRAGAKVTGRTPGWSFGLLDVQTGDHEPRDPDIGPIRGTNWGVARIKRNLGERSSVGAIFTSRQTSSDDWNRVLGIDADVNPSRRLNFTGFLARSDDADGPVGWVGGGGFEWNGTIWRANASVQDLREEFNPGLGFLPRKGVRRYSYSVEFEPRPDIGFNIRNLSFNQRTNIVTSTDGTLESVDATLRFFGFELDSGDRVTFFGSYNFERLFEPFEIFDGVTIPEGDYDFGDLGIFINTDGSRPISFFAFWTKGPFFDGDRTMGNSSVTLRLNRFVNTATEWNFNQVSLPGGEFTTHVVQQRVRVALSPNLFWNTFAQLNTAADLFTVQSRFNWIYRPGADIFLVYNQDWDTNGTEPINRAVIFKFTYLFTL